MSAVNTSAAPAAAPAPAANAKGGLLGGLTSLFAAKPANAKNASANAGKSIKNNILTAGYSVMKADEIFSNWIDG